MGLQVSNISNFVIDDYGNIVGYQKKLGSLFGLGITMAPDAPVTGSRTLNEGDLEKCLDVTAAATLTIPTDAALNLTENTKYRACISVYQAGAGAASFTAGAGVTLRGTAPTAAQYTVVGIMRVGANEWAYL